jgi:CheY-like chemotaxis protein
MTSPEPLQHVLYVDDEPDMRMLVQITLENMGNIKTTVCENGLDVLEKALDERPQMIILDVMMQGMDGPAILREIRNQPELAATPVIFLTGRNEQGAIDSYLAMGAAGVIAKPFDLTALPGQVRALWEKSHD